MAWPSPSVVQGASADPVARLEHDHRVTALRELPRGRQAGESGADDHDVGIGAGGAEGGGFRKR